jgi:chemotaxis protein methyltransferase CheR
MIADDQTSPVARTVLGALMEARTGQRIAAGRAWRIETALRPLLRDRGLSSLDELVTHLLDGHHPALADQAVDAMLNGETSFFRDAAVLSLVAEVVEGVAGRRARVWSAGCSTGQEALSLAMLLAERGRVEADVVGTDVSDTAVARARAGRYSHFEIQRGLPIKSMMRWFEPAGDDWTARAELTRFVSFRRQNLLTDPAPPGEFDAVLCRNVLLYLAPDRRRRVLACLAGAVRPGGVLVLGAGETVIGQSDAFHPSERWRGLYEPVPRPWPPRAAG